MPNVTARPVTLPRAFGGFDRDHIGAEIRKRLDAHRAEQEMVEADDADSLQQVEHAGSSQKRGTVCERCGGPQIVATQSLLSSGRLVRSAGANSLPPPAKL